MLAYTEQENARYNFSEEMQFAKQIKTGNTGEIKKRFIGKPQDSMSENHVGILAKKSLKQNEYLAVSTIVLASRAAIDGGLDTLTAYLMSDLYLQRLEKCTEISDVHRLMQDAVLHYAECVKRKKESRSQFGYIEQCKNFIARHLNKHFTVNDIAKEIGINKSYLSRRFSESEGMGIQEYTQAKRVEAAANMLRFSNENILKISNYLCFASQSYFGKVFKERMGITPQKYREQNRTIDFKAF